MIPFHPFYNSYSYRRYYYPYRPDQVHNLNCYPNINKSNFNNNNDNKNNNNTTYNQNKKHNDSKNNLSFINIDKSADIDEENFFDFFGIKLSFDDLLILALLFFLYKEETKDPYLYISLILLLLS